MRVEIDSDGCTVVVDSGDGGDIADLADIALDLWTKTKPKQRPGLEAGAMGFVMDRTPGEYDVGIRVGRHSL